MDPKLLQHSVHGLLIASGRATWDYDDEGVGFYSFNDDQSFKWKIHPRLVKNMKVTEDDLLDCVDQIEAEITPESYSDLGPSKGLAPGFGVLHAGIKVRSESHPDILCVFTPVSNEYDEVAGYFEWYLAPEEVNAVTIQNRMDAVEATKAYRTFKSPIFHVPQYEEAMQKASVVLKEDAERFGAIVWEYHHTHMRGIKEQLKVRILNEWKDILQAEDAALSDSKFGADSTVQKILTDHLYTITNVEADDGQAKYFVMPPASLQAADLNLLQQRVGALLGNRFAINFNRNGTIIEVIDLLPDQVIECWSPDRAMLIEVKKKQNGTQYLRA